ncbi:C2H2 type zinc-finger-domain-containing protein [Earliella scabrosa]|nr:C2H2 type zinc-finger-domain-containing protein [Earliella scabrosa]
MASSSTAFTCNTCSITFNSSQTQRSHMREPWHVCNVKRRLDSLPPLTEEEYIDSFEPPSSGPIICPTCQKKCLSKEAYQRHAEKHASEDLPPPASSPPDSDPDVDSDSDSDADEEDGSEGDQVEPEVFPTRCLFCTQPPHDSPTIDANLAHMASHHGLFVPEPDRLIDAPSFLTHLAAIVFRFHECLYCGVRKASAAAAQTHMRDKGHCMINLDNPESKLLEFWELSDDSDEGGDEDEDQRQKNRGMVQLSDAALRLPSGAVVSSRSESRYTRPSSTVHTRAIPAKPTLVRAGGAEIARDDPKTGRATSGTTRRIGARDERGLVGVSAQQRKALLAVEKKMRKRDAVIKSAQRWAAERMANRQKHFRTEVPVAQCG